MAATFPFTGGIHIGDVGHVKINGKAYKFMLVHGAHYQIPA